MPSDEEADHLFGTPAPATVRPLITEQAGIRALATNRPQSLSVVAEPPSGQRIRRVARVGGRIVVSCRSREVATGAR
jgi:hypothetical protein